MTRLDPATCARCGAPFGCGAATGGCWCTAVAVPEPVLARLADEYAGCLCGDCLRAIADEAAPAAT